MLNFSYQLSVKGKGFCLVALSPFWAISSTLKQFFNGRLRTDFADSGSIFTLAQIEPSELTLTDTNLATLEKVVDTFGQGYQSAEAGNTKCMSNKSHLAALHRKRLSPTAKAMLNLGLLSTEESHLDYGCGRGGDVERLLAAGYKSTGYDPYYFPDTAIAPTDVVSFNYVLNVIADPKERREALQSAWSFAKKRLIVSAIVNGKGIRDGNFTGIGTFNKPFNHIELKAYIESVLGFEAISFAKDRFVVHRDGRQFTPLHYEEVLEKVKAISQQGWIPNMDVILKAYNEDFTRKIRHYRLLAKSKCLPYKNRFSKFLDIRNLSMMQWAIFALQRRNLIAEMKFHCQEQTFIKEFLNLKKFDFLNINNIKIYH